MQLNNCQKNGAFETFMYVYVGFPQVGGEKIKTNGHKRIEATYFPSDIVSITYITVLVNMCISSFAVSRYGYMLCMDNTLITINVTMLRINICVY